MRHPLHPMLVHVPVACWLLAPLCDVAALAGGWPVLWTMSALLIGVGLAGGALAATAGAMDYARAHAVAPRLVNAHVLLMGAAWTIALLALFGRIGADRQLAVPPTWWAIAASFVTALLMIAGAWCGGEMVYGRGIGIGTSRR
ncbi:DUF2231 domain-containing protein [Allosphingosinicella sp.]|uniref:DUF2231 domain-containing protein n=1 Tax=Allosphingosinicella sp. TaxID=2823234 RepID=UPI003783126A